MEFPVRRFHNFSHVRLNASVLRTSDFNEIADLLVIAAGVTWLPITTVTVPTWNIQIVDVAGHAVNGACVSQFWQQTSFEPKDHSEEVKADKSGHVRFEWEEGSIARRCSPV